MYTRRKLEDWVSNALYRWHTKMRKRPPASWASRAAGVRTLCAIDESGLVAHPDTQCSSDRALATDDQAAAAKKAAAEGAAQGPTEHGAGEGRRVSRFQVDLKC